MIVVLLSCLIAVALGADTGCTSRGGHCQTDSLSCSGGYQSGLCDGASSRRCCLRGYQSGLCDGEASHRCCLSADDQCLSAGGHCQVDSTSCGGDYASGLCSGASNRRCCMPAGGGGACTATQKNLACQILHSANVELARRHPSGVSDNAYVYNNLRDMCNGLAASRSSYSCNGCHAPGGRVCLSTDLLRYLLDLKNSGHVIINELAGACHSCTSRHYSGLAVDLHNDARTAEYLRKCTAMGGWGQDEGNHVHCQFYDAPHPNGF